MASNVHFQIPVERGRERFRELIVYISSKCAEDSGFGATKLNKVLFYSDFEAFRRFGRPLTGLPYFRLKNGPAPQWLLPIRRDLIDEGAIRLEQEPAGGGFIQDRTIAQREAFLDLFSKSEIALVDSVIDRLWAKSAGAVSEESHGVAWATRADREPIPYEAAYLSNDKMTDDEMGRFSRLGQERGWHSA